MKKKKIRCFKIYESIGNSTYNYEIIIPLKSGWCNNTLVTCKNCGELFVIDWENPATENLSILDIAGSSVCPTCQSQLKDIVASYPHTIRVSEGVFGSFNESGITHSNVQTEVLEFYELRPRLEQRE